MKAELPFTLSRRKRLESELRYALDKTSKEDYKRWALYTSRVFPQVTVRRASNLKDFAGNIIKWTYSETKDLVNAGKKRELIEHTKKRTNDLIKCSKESLKYLKELISNFNKLIKDEPKDAAIKIFAALMGFNVGGGGIDGDGGIPDLDLMVSIGAHRSIITHSVLPTIFFEGLFLSMIGLVKIVHKNLPADHDPLWDDIKNNNEKFLKIFYNGMSAGLIYHLGFDATIDGDGTYKNLPFSMPQYGHQVLIALNSFTELVDSISKKKKLFWKNNILGKKVDKKQK